MPLPPAAVLPPAAATTAVVRVCAFVTCFEPTHLSYEIQFLFLFFRPVEKKQTETVLTFLLGGTPADAPAYGRFDSLRIEGRKRPRARARICLHASFRCLHIFFRGWGRPQHKMMKLFKNPLNDFTVRIFTAHYTSYIFCACAYYTAITYTAHAPRRATRVVCELLRAKHGNTAVARFLFRFCFFRRRF